MKHHKVIAHFVRMEAYELPIETRNMEAGELEQYIIDNSLEPVSHKDRDWEIVGSSVEDA